MNILIIDSGIELSHPAFLEYNIASYQICNGHAERIYFDNDINGHGTAVCSLICKSLKHQNIVANIDMLKAFSDNEASESEIETALKIVLDDFKPDIINMSFGMSEGKCTKIIGLCKAILEKSIIVSAANNMGFLSIPCVIPGVIGVISDNTITNPYQYNYINSISIQMAAYGGTQRVAWSNSKYYLMNGISFACANATGIVAGIVQKYGKENFNDLLIKYSYNEPINYSECSKYSLSIPFKIGKAAIFPFSKETSSLILFAEMLDFQITDVYDSPISGKVGSKTSQILNTNIKNDFIIKNISDFVADDVDTLILGHIGNYIRYPREEERILTLLQQYREVLNIYMFDPAENSENIFSPVIDQKCVPPCFGNGMLYGIHTPILGVYGTSSKQGKFTLQLELRKQFLKKGYRIGQLGTEPEALLFGFDSVYPMGYNASVTITGNDSILYLNRVLHEIEIGRDVDLIITGSQSGTIPYSFGALNSITLPQIEFLYGTCPDAVVLSINIFDNIDYIIRTIKFIESSVGTKVVALVLFPFVSKSYKKAYSDTFENFDEHCKKLNLEIGLPVFVLGKNMEGLCEIIIDYLSE